MRFCILLILLTFNVKANDSLLVINLPHQIYIEQQFRDAIWIEYSLKSQKNIEKKLNGIIPPNTAFKIVNDSTYESPNNLEIYNLMKRFEGGFKLNKVSISESLFKLLNHNNYTRTIIILTKGLTKNYCPNSNHKFYEDELTELNIYSYVPSSGKKANLSIEVLIYEKALQKFIYYQSAGDYGEPLNDKFAIKVLKSSLEDYFLKGPNLKIKP